MKNKLIIIVFAVAVCAIGYVAAQAPIPAKEELVKPAVPEKRYPSYWVRNFQVRAASPTEGTFYLELLPYNPETGDIDGSSPKELRGQLWELMAGSPKATIAMGAVFQAIPEIEAWIENSEEGEAVE